MTKFLKLIDSISLRRGHFCHALCIAAKFGLYHIALRAKFKMQKSKCKMKVSRNRLRAISRYILVRNGPRRIVSEGNYFSLLAVILLIVLRQGFKTSLIRISRALNTALLSFLASKTKFLISKEALNVYFGISVLLIILPC